jgi:hypothetical protein
MNDRLGGWRKDAEGYVRWRETGYIACRVDDEGTIWVLDRSARDETGKRTKRERALTLDDLREFCEQAGE